MAVSQRMDSVGLESAHRLCGNPRALHNVCVRRRIISLRNPQLDLRFRHRNPAQCVFPFTSAHPAPARDD
jgi:hypothetical protein